MKDEIKVLLADFGREIEALIKRQAAIMVAPLTLALDQLGGTAFGTRARKPKPKKVVARKVAAPSRRGKTAPYPASVRAKIIAEAKRGKDPLFAIERRHNLGHGTLTNWLRKEGVKVGKSHRGGKPGKPHRSFTPDFKATVVREAKEQGLRVVAKREQIHENVIKRWMKTFAQPTASA